ncbi:MAG: T9SS type A sorting domain-containing protein [Fibrobacter sp.]|nr:T9SS type A sorting domain-containing protein [Fibrobacter sp.]
MKKFIYSSIAVAMLASFAAAQESTPVWAEKGCVAFVNGTGDYDQNCYNSGLLEMADGKCYTFNTDRNQVPQWINNVATQTWWWVETTCYDAPVIPPRDPATYTLKDKDCIPFENGTGDYDKHCYNSGLLDMADGKCYTFNTDRNEVPQWINNIASQTWWWVEMECADTVLVSSSSVASSSSIVPASSATSSSSIVPASSATSSSSVAPVSSSVCDPDEGAGCNDDPSSSSVAPASSSVASSSSVAPASSATPVNCADVANIDVEECAPFYQDVCVDFVNGTGDYDQHCYKSGLERMEEGKCYTYNTARGSVPQWINNQASESWWWVETECEKVYVDITLYEEVDKGCIEYKKHSPDGYVGKCFNAGLTGMEEGKCYELNPGRKADRSGYRSVINENAWDSYWWVETSCTKLVLKDEDKSEPKVAKQEPKVAAGQSLEVVASAADVKTLSVFDMNGKLLHSESFTGAVKDVDFAKFAGNGVRLVRITSGNKLVAMKRIGAR